MSRAFVKDDADAERVIVPQRAPLPDGTPNRVTPRGLRLLREERGALVAERDAWMARPEAPDRSRRLTVLRESLADLEDRIATARVVEPPAGDDPAGPAVDLGATVAVRLDDGETTRFDVVGVDEADPLEGRVAFVAPMAAAVLGLRRGDAVEVEIAGARRRGEVTDVRYERDEAGEVDEAG